VGLRLCLRSRRQETRLKLLPRSLLWRTFLLVALLMVLSVAAWFAIFSTYEREPRARQLAQTLVSVANLTRAALVSARPMRAANSCANCPTAKASTSTRLNATDRVEALPDRAFLRRVEELVREQLGSTTRLTLEREGERALFVNFRIDDSDEGDYWLALPRERIDRVFPLGWLGWGVAALLLSLLGAWLIVFRITRPLKALQRAARKVGAGETPERLDEGGPTELATVAHAFNQMSADLAQIDQDRALILAGISHDLRTPLTRLRMGIEMAGDDGLREGMTADVEEMDKTIGQFLDFARSEGGEPPQEVDVAALLLEIASAVPAPGIQGGTGRRSAGTGAPHPFGNSPTSLSGAAAGPAPRHQQPDRQRAAPCRQRVPGRTGHRCLRRRVQHRGARPRTRHSGERCGTHEAPLRPARSRPHQHRRRRPGSGHRRPHRPLPQRPARTPAARWRRTVGPPGIAPLRSTIDPCAMNETATPYSMIGGEAAVRRLVRRFYELMDTLPEAYGIRKLHQPTFPAPRRSCSCSSAAGSAAPALCREIRPPQVRARHMPFPDRQQGSGTVDAVHARGNGRRHQ
jgi:signal transduction histidine kinase